MQSRHLCSLHVWHPEPTSIDIRRKKKTIFRDLVPPFHDFFPPSAPPGSMAPWIRSEEIGRHARRKNEPVSVASRLGTRRSRGVEGRRRGFDAFFFLLLSISLSLFLSFSLSLYLYLLVRAWTELLARWRVVVGHWVAIFAREEKDRRMLKRDHFPGEILFRNSSLPGFIYIPSPSPFQNLSPRSSIAWIISVERFRSFPF